MEVEEENLFCSGPQEHDSHRLHSEKKNGLKFAYFSRAKVIKFDEAAICTQSQQWEEIIVHVSCCFLLFLMSSGCGEISCRF